MQIHIANVNKRGSIRSGVVHMREPSRADDHEAGILDGVAYATHLFLSFNK